jgi:carbohydrate binding protein with CBM4/9 domain
MYYNMIFYARQKSGSWLKRSRIFVDIQKSSVHLYILSDALLAMNAKGISGFLLLMFISLILGGILVFSVFSMSRAQNAANLVSNPNFDQSSGGSSGMPNWTDQFKNCQSTFKCTVNSTTGWNNSTSLQVSTKINKNNTWSSISGKEINVKPNENYDFVTHIKLNEFATGSHIKLEGYNTTSNKWTSLKTQCPVGTKGPLEWQEFSCNITIPNGITKIRPILNAGWSSQPGKEAVTLFDDISIINAIGGKGRGFIAGFIPSAVQS